MKWPQIAVIVIIAMELGVHLAKHGQPRTGNYSFGIALLSWAIIVALLIKGGFWK